MNVSPVSFLGQAIFSRRALKTISPECKQRIENYAAKRPDDTDVFVIGQKIEKGIVYQGEFYNENQYSVEKDVFRRGAAYYSVAQPDGSKIKVYPEETKNISREVPVYIAYLFYDASCSTLDYPVVSKEFDFRPGEPSLIKIGDRLYVDDEF